MTSCIIYTSSYGKMIRIINIQRLGHVARAGDDTSCKMIILSQLKDTGKKGRLKHGG